MATSKRKEEPGDYLGRHLGPRLLLLRKGKMTQAKLAQAVQIHASTLGRIEAGEGRVRPELLRAICDVLGVSSDEVIQRALDDLKNEFQKKSEKQEPEISQDQVESLETLFERFRTVHEERLRGERELRELILKIMQYFVP
jgi:transcriptional regulator with XRE-family HTH domain